jgi:hypothetical protein
MGETRPHDRFTENTLGKYGRVSASLAKKPQWTHINYTIAKDKRSDPYLQDD